MSKIIEEKKKVYIKIANDLMRLIQSGAYRDCFPSEKQLGYSYQVSRMTIRRALAILEERGMLIVSAGKRRKVNCNVDSTPVDSNVVACVVSHYTASYSILCNEITSVLKRKGFQVQFLFQHHDEKVDLDFFDENEFAGLVTLGIKDHVINEISKNTDKPLVVIDNECCTLNLNTVGIDTYASTCMGLDYLRENGHCRIAGIFSENFPRSIAGFNSYCKIHDLCGQNLILHSGINDIDLEKLLNDYNPTAIFLFPYRKCGYTVFNYLQKNKIKVPDDISVFGYDDLNIEVGKKIIHPHCLATDWKAIARIATKRLMGLINGDTSIMRINVAPIIISKGRKTIKTL